MFLGLALLYFASAQTTCPSNPSDSACASFNLLDKNATSLSNDLCAQMPFMSTCLLREECSSSAASFCNPFSSYANICQDMPNMKGCTVYKNQCGLAPQQALSAQCKSNLPLQSFPSTKTVTNQIYSICNEMTMDGCEKCKISSPDSTYANCDIMQVYTQLCQAMPDMSQCLAFKEMCTATPSLSWCAASSGNSEVSPDLLPPSMLMYFHTGIRDYILFKNWVPRNTGEYVGFIIASFLFAVFYEGFLVFVALSEYHWKTKNSKTPKPKSESSSAFGASDFSVVASIKKPWYAHIAGMSAGLEGFQRASLHAIFRLISATWALLLMLIVMSYNVGLFFAVVIGYSIGNLLFAPIFKLSVDAEASVAEPDCC
jgi:solute carrier family 31 (copper transporter), member 1